MGDPFTHLNASPLNDPCYGLPHLRIDSDPTVRDGRGKLPAPTARSIPAWVAASLASAGPGTTPREILKGHRPALSASPAFVVPAGRPIIARLFKGGFAVSKTLQIPAETVETDNGPIHSPERRLAAGFGRTTTSTTENAH